MKAHVSAPAIRLSGCVIARNEQENIARCIRSFRDFVDEIVVVDTGSTDDTAKIAEQLGARVLHFDWRDDFAAARNFALDQVSGDWIVFPDADEYFSEGCGAQVRKCIGVAECGGYNLIGCKWPQIDPDHPGCHMAEGFVMRILKKGVRYCYAIHEEPTFPEGRHILYAEKIRFYLNHTGYRQKVNRQKAERNLAILLREAACETDPIRRGIYDLYLSDSYMTLKEYDKCYETAARYVEFSRKNHFVMIGKAAKAYWSLLTCCRRLHKSTEELEEWTREFAKEFPDSPDADDARARLLAEKRENGRAEAACRRTIRRAEAYTGMEPCRIAASLFEAWLAAGQALESQRRLSEAMEWYYQAWNRYPDYKPLIVRLLGIVKAAPTDDVDRYVQRLFDDGDMTRHAALLTGLMENYMSRQLTWCYSKLKSDAGENGSLLSPRILAFVAAGKGNYEGASRLFARVCQEWDEPATAMRSLLCAAMSGDRAAVDDAVKIASPKLAAALGFAGDVPLERDDLPAVAGMVAEAGRMRGGKYAAEMAVRVAQRLETALRHDFALCLERDLEFSGALAVAEMLDVMPETAFLCGYYALQSGRQAQAALALAAACRMGYAGGDVDEARGTLSRLQAQNGGRSQVPAGETGTIAGEAASWIGAGDYGRALERLLPVFAAFGPEAELCSIASVAWLESGQAVWAALAAEAGLSADCRLTDLYINAGDAYRRLGDRKRADEMIRLAAETCGDPRLRMQIEKEFGLPEQAAAASDAGSR